jgi:hypothetical protein
MKTRFFAGFLVAFFIGSGYVPAVETTYEVWKGNSSDLGAARMVAEVLGTSYDDFAVTPGQTYFYWVRVTTTETVKGTSNSDPTTFRSMDIYLTCPLSAKRGTRSRIVTKIVFYQTGFRAVGDVTCVLAEKDVFSDDPMASWAEKIFWFRDSGTLTKSWVNEVDVGAWELSATAEVYQLAQHVPDAGENGGRVSWEDPRGQRGAQKRL